VPADLASARVGEHLVRFRGEAVRVVEFPIGERSFVGHNHRSAKLERQPVIEIESQNAIIRFTSWVRHDSLDRFSLTMRLSYLHRGPPAENQHVIQ
jgi:hypothetical protein